MKHNVSRRSTALVALLALLCAAWGVDQYRNRALALEIEPYAANHVAEFRGPDVSVASQVTVSRTYVLFGDPLAKVEVFVAAKTPGATNDVSSIEYDYRREKGTWTLVESGRCSGAECQVRAREVLKRLAPN